MKKEYNPQYYPTKNMLFNTRTNNVELVEYGGIDLLDYFAGQALIPLLSKDSKDGLIEEAQSRGCKSPDEIGQILAESCYNIAEDMLEERKKRNELQK